MMEFEAFVKWPEALLTQTLVLRALNRLSLRPILTSALSSDTDRRVLQWATYDSIDHELTLSSPRRVLSSSYTIRKALIRKHFLHRCILAYTTKHPESSLIQYVPRTWDIEISFADELDELWGDELWDLKKEIESGGNEWWILKPGMADRGMGIRLFASKDDLQRIFEEFEEQDGDDGQATEDTNVVTSQLRHFVIQEYMAYPVLLDPKESPVTSGETPLSIDKLQGRKFHLRTYCVAAGALSVHLYTQILALFSSEAYKSPVEASDPSGNLDLRPHLTNTCLQGTSGEANVRLLHELIGCTVLSGASFDKQDSITQGDIESILDQITDVLAETFKAALQMPVHFQPLPNAFELFGVDFLVSHAPPGGTSGKYQVKLLEFNSEPAIEMTGSRLRWILEDLFEAISKMCVEPFCARDKVAITSRGKLAETRLLRKCLEVNLRG